MLEQVSRRRGLAVKSSDCLAGDGADDAPARLPGDHGSRGGSRLIIQQPEWREFWRKWTVPRRTAQAKRNAEAPRP
jgi:hypothetical protein